MQGIPFCGSVSSCNFVTLATFISWDKREPFLFRVFYRRCCVNCEQLPFLICLNFISHLFHLRFSFFSCLPENSETR